jgi:hypothetical protein
LTLNNAANAQVGSASSALSTGVWYRLELKCDSTNATGTIDARLDGTSFASGNNSSRGSWARILWGAITPNSTCDLFFDDVALNDDLGSNQTSWPGDEKLICLRPNVSGDSNQWKDTAGSAGTSNNYQLVDETPPNDATDYIQSTTLNDVDFYNVGASGIGGSDTVNVVTVHGRLTNDVADATIAAKLRIEKTGSGTVTEGSAIIPNTTTWQTDDATATFKPTLVTYADPDASAWTQTTLDSMQIGAKITTDSTNKILISALWAYVGYTPSAGTSVTVTPSVQSVVASIIAAAIILGATISPVAQASTFSIQTPAIKTDQVLTIPARTSVFSSQAPIVIPETRISTTVQASTFSIQAPTIVSDSTLSIPVQSGVFSLQSPTVLLGIIATTSIQEATFTIPSPVVVVEATAIVNPSALSAVFSIQSPSVISNSTFSLSAQSATLNLIPPTVNTRTDVTVQPTVQAVAFSIQSPSIVSNSVLTITAQSSVFSLQSPTVLVSITSILSAQSATFSIVPPGVVVQIAVVVSPNVQSAVFSLQSPTLKYDFKVTVNVATATLTIQHPTRTGPFYESKYSTRASSYASQYSSRGTNYENKYL